MRRLESLGQPTQANSKAITDELRYITQLVAWGDQHDPEVFEAFMEYDLLGKLREFMKCTVDAVHVCTRVCQ